MLYAFKIKFVKDKVIKKDVTKISREAIKF